MTQNWETFLRSLGAVVLGAILLWASNQVNLAPILGVPVAIIVASLAAVLDKSFSPDGTVVFGSVGKRLY
jgi:hypothetical protein